MSFIDRSEEIQHEMNTTGNVAGYNVPGAFSDGSERDKKRRKKNAEQNGMELVQDFKEIVNEVYGMSYQDYLNDKSMTSVQKINSSIKDINRKLYEIELVVKRNLKLKSETGFSSDNRWKSSFQNVRKIQERLTRLNRMVRELAS